MVDLFLSLVASWTNDPFWIWQSTLLFTLTTRVTCISTKYILFAYSQVEFDPQLYQTWRHSLASKDARVYTQSINDKRDMYCTCSKLQCTSTVYIKHLRTKQCIVTVIFWVLRNDIVRFTNILHRILHSSLEIYIGGLKEMVEIFSLRQKSQSLSGNMQSEYRA